MDSFPGPVRCYNEILTAFSKQEPKPGKEEGMSGKIVTGLLCAVLALSFGIGGGAARADDKNLLIATATTGGTYYPVDVAIGTLISLTSSPA
jgi:hypothetical protein